MTPVLIVDDNAHNLYMLRVLLEAEGYAVEQAGNGEQALALARQRPPRLVVSDLLMPVMDGYMLLRHWRADPDLATIPFVVYTATYVEPKDERLALAMGADAFLLKPSEPEALMACLREAMDRAAGHAPAAGRRVAHDDRRLLEQYNEVLVRKLEKRALQLEQHHRELQQSEERFRATFEHAAVGIAHVGLDGRFLRVNDKLCEILGYPRAELLQLGFAAITVPEDVGRGEQARQAMLEGTLDHHADEKRYRRQDGGSVWVSLVTTLLRSRTQGPSYFISVITDISERKALENELAQAQKLESVGQLTAGIAHDFNNLLTVIIGNSELLVEHLAGDERLGPLARVTRGAAQRGAELTRQLLAFARRQVLTPRVVDVNGLLQGLDRMLRRMLPESIDIVLVPGGDLWPALVDPSQLEAAVLNLVINARDAMPSGGRLTIESRNVEVDDGAAAQLTDLAPGAYVALAVSDTGTGIAPEHLARVFDPFFTTKPVGQGSGLGLSMVYGFAKQSHGHVSIDSEPSRGTTVRLYLPRAAGAQAEAGPETMPGALELQGGECILLAEDDALVREFAERQLQDLGYRVVSAANGVEALEVLRARPDIDLLLTDVVMPGGLGGPELAKAARALRPGLKVLFSSGYADQALLHGHLLEPGVNLLGKPYGRRELAQHVKAVLAEGPVRPAAEAGTGSRLLVLDDDPMVAMVLGTAAQRLGFEVETTTSAPAFFGRVAGWAPSHVAIDLGMPGLDGLQVLDRLAEAGCRARIVIASGADPATLEAALAHARARGLVVAGALPKPFEPATLRTLLLAA